MFPGKEIYIEQFSSRPLKQATDRPYYVFIHVSMIHP